MKLTLVEEIFALPSNHYGSMTSSDSMLKGVGVTFIMLRG